MERIREQNINTKEYWNLYADDTHLERDRMRGGTRCRFASVLEELTNLREKHFLDIGCFNGNFYNFIKENGKDVNSFTGIDHSEKLIQQASTRFPSQRWIISDYSKLPVNSDSYDVVTAFEILEHIENPDNLISEAFRTCSNGGKIIVSTPNKTIIDDPEHVWKFESSDIYSLLSKYSTNVKVFLTCSTNRNIIGIAIKGFLPYL